MSILNTKKSDDIKEILNIGEKEEFWRIIVDALDQSIEALQNLADSEDMKDLSPERYKLENELIKAKINYLKTLKNTPENLRSWLSSPDNRGTNFDPYGES